MTPDPLLKIDGLTLTIGKAAAAPRVLDNLGLTVRPGEIHAIVGESGSGKSMMAMSVMGLQPNPMVRQAGRILFEGRDLCRLSEAELTGIRGNRIGMLFQQPKVMLDPTAKVGSQIAEAISVHRGIPARKVWPRVIELLEEVGIPEPEKRARSYSFQLSGGMAQRVMIAAALSCDPDLLIADEPTTALDVTIQAQILDLIVNLRKARGLTVILITHDLGIVTAIADRVSVMYAGRIVETGDARSLVLNPRHPYTQSLIRASHLARTGGGDLYAIRGSVRSALTMTRGCRFAPRCDVSVRLGLEQKCHAAEPEFPEGGAGHSCRCWADQKDMSDA